MLVPSPSMRELLTERLRVYGEQLEKYPEALTYLENRGITKQIAKDFELGFVGEPLIGDGRYQGRIAIPYLTPTGPVSFKFRAIEDTDYRYTKDTGDPARIFNTRILVRQHDIYVTEGELDCIAAVQCGLPAVGIPGAKAWKPEWSRVFYQRQIIVLADGDDAGAEFAERVAEKVYGVRIVSFPSGQDVCSVLQSKGVSGVRNVVLGEELE